MPDIKLECTKCGKAFDYSYIPGVAINAIRIWNHRYMQCPMCRHWSLFSLSGKKSQ